jgi:hypothetical protein
MGTVIEADIRDPPSTAAVTAAEVVVFKNVRRVIFFSFSLKVSPNTPLRV